MSPDINIKIAKTSFQSGETIEGTITLQLDKPIKSRGVYVSLLSYEGSGRGSHSPGGKGGGGGSSRHVWDSQTLDSEREYLANQSLSYPFQFTAPSISTPYNPLEDLWRGLTKDKSPRNPGMKTYWIEAKVNIPMAIDIYMIESIKIQYELAPKKPMTYRKKDAPETPQKITLKEEEREEIINHFTNIRVETTPFSDTVDSTIHRPGLFSPVIYPNLTLKIIGGKIDYYEFYLSDPYLSNYVVKANTSRYKREVKAECDASLLESKKQGDQGIKWSGGRIAETLNMDSELRKVIPIPNSCITLVPSENHVDINFTRYIWVDRLKQALPSREEYEVFERIADHIRDITKPSN